MLLIDASHGEGGGQLLRTAVALSAITGRALELRGIRARRSNPGLAPQHLLAVRAVATLCGAQVEGLALRSQGLRFVPIALTGGRHEFNVGTAGSVPLVLQALLPAMVAAGSETIITVHGGTDIRGAPPVAYLAHVLLPLLQRMGADLRLDVLRRGYYPRGGGVVRLAVVPTKLQPLVLENRGALLAIEGEAHVAHLPDHIAVRMRQAALALLPRGKHNNIETAVLGGADALGKGGAIVLWARFAHTTLGAGRVARIGVRAEDLGQSVAKELVADICAGATADMHAADQLLVYLALARGGSFLTRAVSTHAETAIWLIEQFLPVRFELKPQDGLIGISVATCL